MNRRLFLHTATGAAMLGPFAKLAVGVGADDRMSARRRLPKLVSAQLSTPVVGFPTLTPIFAAAFVPGTGQPQLVRSESFDDFSAQVASQAASGYTLACYTTIQNMNRTWFYGVFQPGSGAYILMRTPDPNAFQQAFTQQQGSYTLVDFNIAWELGQLYYSGYWLAASAPKQQSLVWDLGFDALSKQWTTLSNNGMRMSRIQAFPERDAASFSALFEAGTGGYVLYDEAIQTFAADVTGKFGGNTLMGLGYDPVAGNMSGCWRAKVNPSQFVYNQDWDTLSATVQQAAGSGMVVEALSAYPNAPSFDDYLEANLAPFTMGYGYAVAKDGEIIASGGGSARGPHEKTNANVPFTGDTRLNLASVSKAITGINLEVLLQQHPEITLDSPFWPLVQAMVPNPDASVKTVTLRNLATMKSGMTQEANEGPISPPSGTTFWGYLNTYLSKPLVATPGVTYYYDNTNFSILQGVIEQVSGMTYIDFATEYVLKPAGLDPAILSATPDPQSTAALTYSGPDDTRAGYYWGPLGFIGPAGWISSARELVKLIAALRGTSILPASAVSEMFNDGIGWYTNNGNFGSYYQHNGSIGNGLTPSQRLNTCVFHFAEGYDMALVSDSLAPADVTSICQGAFDSRGLAAADLPSNAVSVTSVIHAVSYLPKVAPGAYVSIIGSGFGSDTLDWTAAIGSGTTLPLELDGIRVRVGGQFVYVQYVNPGQVNFLLPVNTAPGVANVELTTLNGGVTTSVEILPIAPGLSAYRLNGTLYPAALFAGTDTYVAAPNALPGYSSRAARAGDVIEIYGTGMGPTNPAAPDGVTFSRSYPAADLSAFVAIIGGKTAQVQYAGMIAPGLFQVNVQIPNGLAGGDQPLALTVSGNPIQPNLMLTIG